MLEQNRSEAQFKLAAKPWIMRALVGLAMRWEVSPVKAGAPLHKVVIWCPFLDNVAA